MSATTTQLLSSGEFCKLRYVTIPAKSASTNVSFYTNNSKMPNFDNLQERHPRCVQCNTNKGKSLCFDL